MSPRTHVRVSVPSPIKMSLVILVLALVGGAEAGTFTATRFDDPPPDSCLAPDCSLREAIIAANASPGSTVTLAAGTYTLSIPGTDAGAPSEAVGDLDIRVGMTVTGAGAASTIVEQTAGTHRVFEIHAYAQVRIAGMTIRNGTDVEAEGGGCLRNAGPAWRDYISETIRPLLTLDSVTVTGCTSSDVGGGIAAASDTVVVRGTISGNSAGSSGGGIYGGLLQGRAPLNMTLKIAETVISNNTAAESGGGLAAEGTYPLHPGMVWWTDVEVVLSNTRIGGNSAGASGGGISFAGPGRREVTESTISGNQARFSGGGIDSAYPGSLTISHSTVSGNTAGVGCVGTECNSSFGGGVAAIWFLVDNSTFSGNACGPGQVSGGGIYSRTDFGRSKITNSTLTANTCRTGAGLASPNTAAVSGYEAIPKNSIVANNTATDASGGDCAGPITSQGYNLVGNTAGCGISPATGDLVGVDPELGSLQNNGGPTATHALSATSPARNAGNPSGCSDYDGVLFQSDQRGYARPQETRCDIGAYEYGIEAPVAYRLRHPTIGAYLFTLYPKERDSAQWEYGYTYEGICCSWLSSNAADGRRPLYRLYSGAAGEYFFTIYPEERDSAVANYGYVYEGPAAYCYSSSATGRRPWYRLRYGNKHLYTIYPEERDSAQALGYVYEGISCYLPNP